MKKNGFLVYLEDNKSKISKKKKNIKIIKSKIFFKIEK